MRWGGKKGVLTQGLITNAGNGGEPKTPHTHTKPASWSHDKAK